MPICSRSRLTRNRMFQRIAGGFSACVQLEPVSGPIRFFRLGFSRLCPLLSAILYRFFSLGLLPRISSGPVRWPPRARPDHC